MNHYKEKNILITGGAGFIGSHLCEALVHEGAHVTILDNFSTGSYTNISSIQEKITCIEGDITNYDDCLLATEAIDTVFHCAALVSVPEAEAYPQFCFETNIQGTFNVLDAAAKNNCKQLVFSSSAAVYGPHIEPCVETTVCTPTSVYGYSKLIGELLCKQFSVRKHLKTSILRYFNVFGERQNATHPYAGVVAKFTHALRNNLPITVFGDGSQTRDFVPVSEVVYANMLIGSLTEKEPSVVYNIGTGTSITLNKLLENLMEKYPQYTADIIYAPARAGDIMNSSAICTKYLECRSQYKEFIVNIK